MQFSMDNDKDAFNAYCENMQYIQRLSVKDAGFISLIKDGWLIRKYPRVIDKLPSEPLSIILFSKKTLTMDTLPYEGECTYGDITKEIVDNSIDEIIALVTTATCTDDVYIKAVFGVSVCVSAKEIQILGKGEAIIDMHNYIHTAPFFAGGFAQQIVF